MKMNFKKAAAMLVSLIMLISIIPLNVLALMVPVNITETSGAVSLRGIFKERAVDTYEFYVNGELIRSQKVKGGDILYEPETPAESGKTFLGWYAGDDRISFTSGQWNVPDDYEATGATITLQPRFGKLYFATFYTKNSTDAPIMARRSMRDGDTLDTASLNVEPDDNTQQFAYWVDQNGDEVKSPLSLTVTVTDGAETPAWQDADGRLLPAGEDGNLHLYPYFHTGHWINFNKNLSVVAVSYTAPQFVVSGALAVKPTDPIAQSAAYSFREWCRDEAGETPFNFETEIIDEDTVLYAAWDTGNAPYSVVIWKQNVTDRYDAAEKTYEYVESYQRSGQIGAYANVDESQGDISPTKLYGFYLGHYDQDVEIKPDGSTVVNVYYDRQRVNVVIHRPVEEYMISGSLYFYGWETETITGLYDQKISMYPEYEGKIYRFEGDFVGYNLSTYTSGIPATDDNGVPLSEEARKTLYRPSTMATGGFTGFNGGDEVDFSSGREEETGLIYNVGELTLTRTALYIYQTEDGEWPTADGSMDEGYTRVWNMRTTGNATVTIVGTNYTVVAYDVNQRWDTPDFATYKVSPNATNKLTIPKAQIPAGSQSYIYYKRHKFNVEYWDGDTKVGTESIFYQKTVKDSPDHLTEVIPNNPDPAKYKFVGWSLYENKHSAADVTDFDFEMPNKTVKVYAVWAEVRYRVVLDLGAEDAEMDERQSQAFTIDYQDTLDPTFMMAASRPGYSIKGWYRNNGVIWNFANGMTLTLADDPSSDPIFYQSANREYYYYTITLTAKWRSKAPISVVYDLNGGTNGTGDENAFTDGTAYFQDGSAIIVSSLPTPPAEGLKFAGWADANGVVHRGGDAVTLEESIIADGKVTLTATYGADVPTGKIVYRPNGGTGSEIMTPSGDVYYEYNEKVTLLTEAETGYTRTNYHLLGWALDPDATEPDFAFGESVLVTSTTLKNTTDNILYAIWEEDEVTIQYVVASDNTGMGTVSLASETVKIASGTAAGSTASPAATTSSAGYRFKNWTDADGNVVSTDPSFSPAKNSDGMNVAATYYAHFQVTYRVFHYLEGTTIRVAPPEGGWADINEQLNPEKATVFAYEGKEIPLTFVSSKPAVPYAAKKGVNDIIYYYTLPDNSIPLTITVDDTETIYNGGTQYGYRSSDTNFSSHVTVTGLLAGFKVADYAYTGAEGVNAADEPYAGSFGNVVVKNPAGTAVKYFDIQAVPGKLTIKPRTITFTSAGGEKVYDGTPLTRNEQTDVTWTDFNAETGEGFVDGEGASFDISGSQTLVGSSDNTFDVAMNDGTLPANYEIIKIYGLLVVTDGTGEGEDPVDPDLVVTKTAEDRVYSLGETVTFTITAKNIYDQPMTITLSEIEGVTLAESTFPDVPAGETIETTAAYIIVEKDILNGSFLNTVTASMGDIIKTASAEVETEDPNGHLTLQKEAVSTPADGKAYALNEEIVYQITVINDGNLTITDITVTDELTGDTWTIASQAPGESTAFTSKPYTVTEEDVLAGHVLNVVTGKGKSPDPDEPDVPVVPDEDDEDTEDPDGHLTLQKEAVSTPADGKAYGLNEEIVYQITVINDGNLTITDITVTDELTGDTWTVASLVPGESTGFTSKPYTVAEEDVLAGHVLNVVTGKGKSPDPDKPDVPVEPDEDDEPTKECEGVVITSGSNTWVYDGSEHSEPTYTVTYGDETATADETGRIFTLSTGDTVEISDPASVTSVAETENAENNNTYTYTISRPGLYEVTANYGTLVIQPRPVTITTGSAEKVYDGTPLTDATFTVDGMAEGESVTIETNGTITDVGTAENTYTIAWDNASADNYTVTDNLGTLQITPVPAAGYRLTIHYVFQNGEQASEDYTDLLTTGTGYSVVSPVIAGYRTGATVVEGTMGDQAVVITVIYVRQEYYAVLEDYETPLGFGMISINVGETIE